MVLLGLLCVFIGHFSPMNTHKRLNNTIIAVNTPKHSHQYLVCYFGVSRSPLCVHRSPWSYEHTQKRANDTIIIRATWLIHMCDMIHSCVRHDSFICVTWVYEHTQKRPNDTLTPDITPISVLSAIFFLKKKTLVDFPCVFISHFCSLL